MFKYSPQMYQGNNMPGMVTPQAKIIEVATNNGNPAVAKMQGTSRIIYDTLPLDGRTEYAFFDGAGARNFPLTNVNSAGGKLGVAEAMVIQYVAIQFFTANGTIPGTATSIVGVQNLADIPNFLMGELSFLTGEQQVQKKLKLSEFSEENNKDARIPRYNKYRFDTYVTIQSLLEFVATLKPAFGVTVTNGYVQLIFEGVGSLYSPKSNQ